MPRPKKETVNIRIYKTTHEHLYHLLARARIRRPKITLMELLEELSKAK